MISDIWPAVRISNAILARSVNRARQVGATPRFNRQGQAQIVSTAIRSPGPTLGPAEVEIEAMPTPWFRTWFSVAPQTASISPTVNINIVFICALLPLWPDHLPSGNQKRFMRDPCQAGGLNRKM